ncbi:MAG: response regulator transcription factor, partial [Myxococcota bacterium]
EGYEVEIATDGETGLDLALELTPCLVLLDVMLPKLSGHEVCRRLRERGFQNPIIMLTARGQEVDKILGLKLGADDYVTKPFSLGELLARVEAVLRRTGGVPPSETRVGDAEVDLEAGEVRRAGEIFDLSGRESRLLRFLLEHRGKVVTRDDLLDHVWDYDDAPLTRTVDVHVSKLRKKLEMDPQDPRHLVTVHGVGYKLK